jgi:hypothetical protein
MNSEIHFVGTGDFPDTPRIVLAFWRTEETGEFPWGFISYCDGIWAAVSDQGWVEAFPPFCWFDLPLIQRSV